MKWLYLGVGFLTGWGALTALGWLSIRRAHCSTLGYAQPTQKWHKTWQR
jgi:hypothetical protein